MTIYNFADQYKAAGMAPGPEIIGLRQAPFEKLRKNIDLATALNLTRLYFGLSLPQGTDWFRDAFYESDKSFSMLDNAREASVLSVCILAAALEDGNAYAALAPLAASANGNRTPLVSPGFIETARQSLYGLAASTSGRTADINAIKLPAKSKVPALADALVAAPDWAKAVDIMKLTSNETSEAIKALANQVFSVFSPLVKQVNELREEVDMLWWYIGGRSRVLDQPFEEMDVGLAALMAGLDLAGLVAGPTGPVAAPAIFHRLIANSSNFETGKVTLESAVAMVPLNSFDRLAIPDGVQEVMDLCPVLSALVKAHEIGGNGAWHGAFKKTCGLEPTTIFGPLELAVQIYRESLLVAQIT